MAASQNFRSLTWISCGKSLKTVTFHCLGPRNLQPKDWLWSWGSQANSDKELSSGYLAINANAWVGTGSEPLSLSTLSAPSVTFSLPNSVSSQQTSLNNLSRFLDLYFTQGLLHTAAGFLSLLQCLVLLSRVIQQALGMTSFWPSLLHHHLQRIKLCTHQLDNLPTVVPVPLSLPPPRCLCLMDWEFLARRTSFSPHGKHTAYSE